MRYRGQEYTLPVPVTEDLRGLKDFGTIRTRFDQLHQEHYGHSAPNEPVMMVNLRLSALGKFDNKFSLSSAARDVDRGERARRRVIFESEPVDCPIYLRTGFRVGDQLEGPAVIEEVGATILVYPGDRMQVNDFGHLVIEVTAGS
jgi:N-methylhydantoinase A